MKNNYYIADFLLLGTLSLLLYSSDPVFHVDSERYIKQSFMDPQSILRLLWSWNISLEH